MIVSDAPNCDVNYDRHYDHRNSFIIQAIGLIANGDASLSKWLGCQVEISN
jgi:hypothetical protein